MGDWKFERVESAFEEVPVGEHRVRIKAAEKMVSQSSGRDMIKLQLEVSGQKSSIFHYIVFLEDRPEITNRNLTQLFDSFGIEDGNFTVANWVGKAGACMVKHDEEGRAKVQYFINKKKQESLPPWRDANATGGGNGQPSGGGKMFSGTTPVNDDDLPF